jgi:hypothetical protein
MPAPPGPTVKNIRDLPPNAGFHDRCLAPRSAPRRRRIALANGRLHPTLPDPRLRADLGQISRNLPPRGWALWCGRTPKPEPALCRHRIRSVCVVESAGNNTASQRNLRRAGAHLPSIHATTRSSYHPWPELYVLMTSPRRSARAAPASDVIELSPARCATSCGATTATSVRRSGAVRTRPTAPCCILAGDSVRGVR